MKQFLNESSKLLFKEKKPKYGSINTATDDEENLNNVGAVPQEQEESEVESNVSLPGNHPFVRLVAREIDFYRISSALSSRITPTFRLKYVADRAFWGASAAIQDMWPAAFAGLLIHDLIQFARFSQEHNGNTIWNILLGNLLGRHVLGGEPNQYNLTQNLGSYILSTDYTYWLGTALVLSLPVVMSTAAVLAKTDLYRRLDEPNAEILGLDHARENFLVQLYRGFFPWSGFRKELSRAEYNLLHNEENVDRGALYGNLIAQAKLNSWTNIAAIRTLANLVAARHDSNSNKQQALRALQALSTYSDLASYFSVTKFFANFHQAKVGRNDKFSFNAFHVLRSAIFLMYGAYATFHFLDIIYQKLADIDAYLADSKVHSNNKAKCDDLDEVYYYANQIADYICQFCPWDFVNWNDRNSVQGCFDAVMRNPNLSPAKVLEYVGTLRKHQGITDVQLPPSFSNFTPSEQKQFYDMVEGMVGSQGLNSFNAVIPNPNPMPLPIEQVDTMADFIKATSPKIVDVTNNNLGDAAKTVIDSLAAHTETFIFNGNSLTDGNRNAVLHVPTEKSLKKIGFENIGVTSDDLIEFSSGLHNSTLVEIDLGNNQFGDRGLAALATGIANNPQVETLDISGNQAISSQGLQLLGAAIQTSGTQIFRMSNVGAGDNEMYAVASFFPGSNLKTVDVSQNPAVTDSGITYVFQQCANTTITSINAAGVLITDEGMQIIGVALPNTVVEKVDFSDTQTYGVAGLSALISNDTQLTSLRMANNNNLGSQAGCVVAEALEQPGNRLQHIDLSNTGMADNCAVLLFQESANAEIKTMIVANNPITPASTSALVNLVQAGQVETLSLSGTQVDASTTQAIAPVLHGSTIKNLDLSDTSQGDLGVDVLAENLIAMNPASSMAFITDPTLSVDQRHSLYLHGQQNTNVSQLNLFNIGASSTSNDILCRRVLPHTNTIITPDPCQASQSSSRNRASSFFDGSWRATLTKVVTGGAAAAATVATADGLTHQNNSAPFSPVQASRELPDWRLCLLLAGSSLLVVFLLCRLVYNKACEFEARDNKDYEKNYESPRAGV